MDSVRNEKMRSAQQGIARLRKIDAMLQDLQKEQSQLSCKTAALKAVFEKENLDVEKIERKGVASVFYSLFGKLEERVEKEQAEALAAKLKYDQALRDTEDMKAQIVKLSAERRNYVNCQKDFDALYAEKKEQILKEGGKSAQRILELTNRINKDEINLKEMEEALSAGREALAALNRIQDSLGHAEGWGTWDLLGGGLVSDLAKHSHIDDAKEGAETAQRLLRQFHAELADVQIYSDIHIETGGFAKFADFFFDGLVSDWFMQSKINQSQESVSNVQSQVVDTLNRLEAMKSQTVSDTQKTEAEMESLITTVQ